MKKVTPLLPEKKQTSPVYAALFWLIIWYLTSALVGKELFLPSPLRVLICFFGLCKSLFFWKSILFSMVNILTGFVFSVIIGIFLAFISYLFPLLAKYISFPLKIIRTIPVASFIILALLWISSRRLSMFIAFITVLPIIYTNIHTGLCAIDIQLLIMANLYDMPLSKKIKLLYLPAISPSLLSALENGIGFAWKSGIAAEVIGITKNSIGNNLNQSKIYLETPELFAWTLTIIIISLSLEKVFHAIFSKIENSYSTKSTE